MQIVQSSSNMKAECCSQQRLQLCDKILDVMCHATLELFIGQVEAKSFIIYLMSQVSTSDLTYRLDNCCLLMLHK